jgi:tetratricopeptide (TPR) repeat protein
MKIIFSAIALAATICAVAQPKKTTPGTTSKSNVHIQVFNQTLASGDGSSAIAALNYFIAEQGMNTPYADTLAMLYMQQNAYAQCLYWAEKRLAVKPADNALLELKAVSLERLQQPVEAIATFEKLFKQTMNPYHAYKLMELQYGIKRLMEAVNTAQSAEKLQFKPEMTMTYAIDQNRAARTSLLAGIYNIHALALYDLDRKAEAKEYFQKALAIDTGFVLAKQNLEALRVAEEAGKKK